MFKGKKVINLESYRKGNGKFEKMTVEDGKKVHVGMPDDCYCVMCGTYVPEGMQVCNVCLEKYAPKKR